MPTSGFPRLSGPSLLALRGVILGIRLDAESPMIGRYRTHTAISDFFDETNLPAAARACDDSREKRMIFALKAVNGTKDMLTVIRTALQPGHFESAEDLERARQFVNAKFQYDSLCVSIVGNTVVVGTLDGVAVEMSAEDNDPLSDKYIQLLIQRAEHRLGAREYDAAVTTARTLLEDVLHAIELKILGTREEFGGDLMRLYKHVSTSLRLDDRRPDLDDHYRSVVRGLASVIGALSPISNAIGDRHSPRRLPAPHHARLCVNAAKTVVVFLRDSFVAQGFADHLPRKNAGMRD